MLLRLIQNIEIVYEVNKTLTPKPSKYHVVNLLRIRDVKILKETLSIWASYYVKDVLDDEMDWV